MSTHLPVDQVAQGGLFILRTMKILLKNELKNGYYYSGYIHQHYCVICNDEQQIVGMWDVKDDCFWFWEFEGNRKTKTKLNYLPDIDNEIQYGFFPVKETFPKDEHVI